MYESDFESTWDYLVEINSVRTKKRISGRIYTESPAREWTWNDANLMPKTFTYVNQCTEDGRFSVGGAFAGKLQMTLVNVPDWVKEKAKIEISVIYDLSLMDTEYHHYGEFPVPFQTFTIDKITRKRKQSQIVAYDNMIRLDKNFAPSQSGKAFSCLTTICNRCGLHLANTEQEIDAMPNALEVLFLDQNDLPTCRDAIKQIVTLLCAFATINREDKLEIRKWKFNPESDTGHLHRTLTDHVRIMNTTDIHGDIQMDSYSASFVDNNRDIVHKGVTDLKNTTIDFGVIYILPRYISAVTDPIEIQFQLFADSVNYKAFSCRVTPDPTADLGDAVWIEIGNDAEDPNYQRIPTTITHIVYRYSQANELSAEGETDAQAQAQTYSDALEYQIRNSVSRASLMSLSYTNSDAIEYSADWEKVGSFRFSCTDNSHVMIIVELPIYSTKDGYCEVRFDINGVETDSYDCQVMAGINTIVVADEWSFDKGASVYLEVFSKARYYESDNRVQEAKISTIWDYINNGSTGQLPTPVVDTTRPVFTIGADSIREFLWGKGFDTVEIWGGIITLASAIYKNQIYGGTASGVSIAQMSVSVTEPMKLQLSSSISRNYRARMIDKNLVEFIEYNTGYHDEWLYCNDGVGAYAGNYDLI